MSDAFDNLISKAKEAAAVAGKMAGDVVDSSKLKIREAKLSTEIKEAYERLGSVVYDSIKHDTDNRQLVDMVVTELDGLLQELEELKTKEVSDRDKVMCPQCGTLNDEDFTFCSKCGAALYQKPEPTEE